jgi:hypothetical protein
MKEKIRTTTGRETYLREEPSRDVCRILFVICHLSTTAISPASAPHPCRFHASPLSNRPSSKHDEDPAEVDTETAIP